MNTCWCGNSDLSSFSPEYRKCGACKTLVTTQAPKINVTRVTDDERDFYGKDYWFSHQEQNHGFPNILVRAREDLSNRCLFWLRHLLNHKLPPGRSLEVGSGHGGFVALLRCIGFEATGLELSPWLVEFSRKAFDVPILQGPIEDQVIEPGSLDFIVVMDVLEHFPDPVATMRRCGSLLKPEGLLLIQTPMFPEERTYADLVAHNDVFVKMLIGDEHIFLFSASSIRVLFGRLGYAHTEFQPAIAPHDMFVAASRTALASHTPDEIDSALVQTSGGRLVQALLDLHRRVDDLQGTLAQKDDYIVSFRTTLAAENKWLAHLNAALGMDTTSWPEFAGKVAGQLKRMIGKRLP